MISPEVLMYLQHIKKYFKDNETAQKYFAIRRNEEAFYEYLEELSQKNFEDKGEPELTIEQFELLRKRMHGTDDENHVSFGVFVSLGDLGYISLN